MKGSEFRELRSLLQRFFTASVVFRCSRNVGVSHEIFNSNNIYVLSEQPCRKSTSQVMGRNGSNLR